MFLIRWSLMLLIPCGWGLHPLQAQVNDSAIVMTGHLDAVSMGVFAPDGKTVVTTSFDKTARVWDTASGDELRQYTQHTAPLFCLAVSGDGTTLVTGAQDNTVRIWDLPPGVPSRVFSEHQLPVTCIQISPDGKSLVSASADKTIRTHGLLDEPSATAIRTGHLSNILSLAYRKDGAYFATGDATGHVYLWSPFLENPQAVLNLGQGGVNQLCFSADNKQLYTADQAGMVRSLQLLPPATIKMEIGDLPLIDWSVNPTESHAICVTANATTVMDLASGAPKATYEAPKSRPTAVTHAPNASWFAISDRAGKTQLYNYSDGVLRETLDCHQGAIHAIAAHPDSVRFATCGADGKVQLWQASGEPEDSRQPITTWQIKADAVVAGTAIAFSPNQQHLYCGTADGTIHQWNLSKGELLRSFEAPPTATPRIADLKITANSQTLVSIGDDRTLRTWNLPDGSPIHTLQHPVAITGVSLSPDSLRAAVACQDGFVRIWELSSGRLLELIAGHDSAVRGVGYLSDGKTLATLSTDGTLRLSQRSVLRAMPIHNGAVRSMAMDSSGGQILSCGDDHRIVLTNASTGSEVRSYRVVAASQADAPKPPSEPSYLEIHPTCVAFRPDNQRIAVGTEEGEVYVWNTNTPDTPLLSFELDSPIVSLAFSPDNLKLAVATVAANVHLLGPSLPGIQPSFELMPHQRFVTQGAISDLTFDLDSQSVWASMDNGEVQQWRYAGLAQRRQLSPGGQVYGVAISNDGQLIASCSTDATVRLWNAKTGQQKAQLRGHDGPVHAIAMSRDETFAVTSGADGTLRLWDLVGGRQLKQLTRFDDTMYTIAISPNGNLIATAGADRRVHLLDMITGEERQTLEGHEDYVHCVAFDTKGERLLSYGYAGHLKIWNTANGKLLHESRLGKVGNYAQFSPDGKQIFLSNGDATARLIAAP